MVSGRSYFAKNSNIAIQWKGLVQKFYFVFFILLSICIIILAKSQPLVVASVRTSVIDTSAPVLAALSRPVFAVQNLIASVDEMVNLYSENQLLIEENKKLLAWKNSTVSLAKENTELRALLNYQTEPKTEFISARVIADAGAALSRNIIVAAGAENNAAPDMAVVTGEGLVGRVVEVGVWTSRVWLITDANSRIPVMIAKSGDRAVLAGDNSMEPKLLFLAKDALVQEGDAVVTSGHGGIFPPNIPVGQIVEGADGSLSVVPYTKLDKINIVKLVNFRNEELGTRN
ncbi:MAG: rod shape-determining protein MreC [Alphaproteobacteria bacterium]|nr:rod shape-determining protein MreC [Alphaproteobacteria bacterium]MCL2505276.1 rod shape-determining protein MreC [Alphaproteobacteria bacterium]